MRPEDQIAAEGRIVERGASPDVRFRSPSPDVRRFVNLVQSRPPWTAGITIRLARAGVTGAHEPGPRFPDDRYATGTRNERLRY